MWVAQTLLRVMKAEHPFRMNCPAGLVFSKQKGGHIIYTKAQVGIWYPRFHTYDYHFEFHEWVPIRAWAPGFSYMNPHMATIITHTAQHGK